MVPTVAFDTNLLKTVGALVVFVIGLWQYHKAQVWKRREFVAAQVKDFEGDRKIQLAMTMLDWNDRELHFPSDSGSDTLPIRVNDFLLCSALLPHETANGYDRHEVAIRDCIDRFLDMLARLDNFVEAGLTSVDELKPYVDYWLRLVSGQKKGWHDAEVFVLLLNYMVHYEFTGAVQLVKKFGYIQPLPKADVEETIRKTIATRSRTEFRMPRD